MNTGHGHVYPREDGILARCGGPIFCDECALDALQKEADMKSQSKTIHISEIAKVLNISVSDVHACMEKQRIVGLSAGYYDRAGVMALSSLFRARGWALEPGDRDAPKT